MVKEIREIENKIREIEEEVLEEFEEEEEEIVGGIFDEDLEHVEEASDFNIANTMLATAPAVESWQGQNLEDTISREHVEKDWGDDEEFVGSDVYASSESSSDVYGADSGSDVYGAGGGSDVYSSGGSSDAYSSGKEGEGVYAAPGSNRGGMKSHDQVKDERSGRRSMLEIVGAEDRSKQRHSEFARGESVYDARKAA